VNDSQMDSFKVRVSGCFMKISITRRTSMFTPPDMFKITFDFMTSSRQIVHSFYIHTLLTSPHYFVKMRFPSLPSHFVTHHWMTKIYQDATMSYSSRQVMDLNLWSNTLLAYDINRPGTDPLTSDQSI